MKVAASVSTAAPRLAFGIGPDGAYTRSGQVIAFVLGVLTMVVCMPLMVAAALLYTKAETVFPHDPGRARTLVNWSWACIAAPALFGVVFGVTFAIVKAAA
ncbi:MAG TPA: hypothetical protein VIL71_13855 [Spirillospora sp.]